MRMWMVNPRKMCRKHLLGKHVECHMLLGSFKRNKKLDGFIKNNCLEPKELLNRHNLLADEMIRRGYNHKSTMNNTEFENYVLKNKNYNHILDKRIVLEESEKDLFTRCKECNSGKLL